MMIAHRKILSNYIREVVENKEKMTVEAVPTGSDVQWGWRMSWNAEMKSCADRKCNCARALRLVGGGRLLFGGRVIFLFGAAASGET